MFLMTTPGQRGKRVKRVKRLRDRTPPPPSDAHASPPPPPPPQPPPEEPASSSAESSYDFSGKKHKRGRSCGKGLHDILEANDGKKMPVIFDLKHQVPSDDKVGALFSSEIGNIVRTSAPVCHLGWKKVSTDDKGKMRDSLTVLFEVDLAHTTSTSSWPDQHQL
ncbi:hypothetical protein ACE6H2_026589 [Prunus campanulata]